MEKEYSDYIMQMSLKLFNGASKLINDRDINSKECFREIASFLLAAYIKIYSPKIILEFTDNNGSSALALKHLLQDGKILSFNNNHDSKDSILKEEYLTDGLIHRFNDNIIDDTTFGQYSELLKHAELIYVDIENETYSKKLFKLLDTVEYESYPKVILSNTKKHATKIWNEIHLPKFDLSAIGSEKGVGIIEFVPLKSKLEDLHESYRFKNLHIGCGEKKLPRFINLDARPTLATDLIHDCSNFSNFPNEHFDLVYSHAFFEHLWADEELPCMKDIYRILNDDGKVLFLGIPDFEVIAKAYSNKSKGVTSEIFDLLQAYRLTHGSPEQSDESWKLEQLHKAIFDKETLAELLRVSGYKNFVIFNYCFREEVLPVNLGFLAFKNYQAEKTTLPDLLNIIKEINSDVHLDTVSIKIKI